MAIEPQPSFSRARKWTIGLNVAIAVILIAAIMAMVNYISAGHFKRWYLSTQTRIELSPLTVSFLKSFTNEVKVTVYYDRDSDFYSDIVDLLKQYGSHNPSISVDLVDYLREPATAEQIRVKYKLASNDENQKDLVIFDSGTRVKTVSHADIVKTRVDLVAGTEREFLRRPVSFDGEIEFTSALLAITSSKPLKAYFLEGHDERSIEDDGSAGYSTFATILRQNSIDVARLHLLGTNNVPADCNLLIIAGPRTRMAEVELQKIQQYLEQGKRLLALLDVRSISVDGRIMNTPTGLEDLLFAWGVRVKADIVRDPNVTVRDWDVVISAFSRHPVVNPLFESGLYMPYPRPLELVPPPALASDPPRCEVLAATTTNAFLYTDQTRIGSFPVIAAVEKISLRGAGGEGGMTRIIIAGDSFFLDNAHIDQRANRDFASLAVNWLVERNYLLQGLAARPINPYQLAIPRRQMQTIQVLFLGAMPGAVLVVGGLVWLRRRR